MVTLTERAILRVLRMLLYQMLNPDWQDYDVDRRIKIATVLGEITNLLDEGPI